MKIKLSKLKPNENNPRIIKEDKFKKLVQSIKDFPEMLDLRPIVVDEEMTILGGNMRYKACIQAGIKEVPIKIATGLTEEQKKEFIVKDNVGFGEWDWDSLGNDWDNVKLGEWGMDVWQPEDEEQYDNPYTAKIETPKYEPTGEKPEINQLYDTEKVNMLIDKIKAQKLPKTEQDFLIYAAYRHTVFNYKNIAEYYTHSSKEIQELMGS